MIRRPSRQTATAQITLICTVAGLTGKMEVVPYVGSTMVRAIPGWNPRSSEGAVTATGQGLIDPGLLERASRR